MKGFIRTASGVVLPTWIDDNGHMNVAAYMALFDRGTDVLLARCGLRIAQSDLTMVAGRILIEHRKELMQGEPWELWSGVAGAHASHVTVTHRLRGGTSLRAVCDIRGKPFSKQKRAAVTLNDVVLKEVRKLLVAGLVDRFSLSPESVAAG